MFCCQCGEELEKDSNFCFRCGTKIDMGEKKDVNKINLSVIQEDKKNYNIIDGWLFIIALFVILSFLYNLYAEYRLIKLWDMEIMKIDSVLPLFATILDIEIIFTTIFLIGYIFLITYLFKRKRFFSKFYIIFFMATIFLISLNFIFLKVFSPNIGALEIKERLEQFSNRYFFDMFIYFFALVFGGLYLNYSKRSEKTFINN